MKVHQLKDGNWEFDSGEIQGTRIRRLFNRRADAETLMRKTKNDIKDHGEKLVLESLSIPFSEIIEILRYRRALIALEGRPNWRKGQDLHTTHLVAKKTGGLLGELLKEYIARKRSAGRNTDYIDRIERELDAFVNRYSTLTAAEITDKHIDSFLDELGVELLTRSNRIRDLSGLFSFAKKRNLCSVNPADLTEPVKIVKKRIKIFSLQEIAVILWVADHHPEWELIPYLGLGLYGSARVSESFRLDWSNLVVEERVLIMESAATKTNQERVTEDLPFILLDWLQPYVQKAGQMSPPESTVEWRRAKFLVPTIQKILPDFKWLKNALRKTSISAAYALTNDVKGTAAKHGTSPEMIFRNYRAVMRKADAARYFELTRANIVSYLHGLVPETELNEWSRKYPPNPTDKS